MTATSVVPPPMSTIMLPAGSCTGSPAPIAAAIGSSMMCAGLRAPADSAASCTARCSTPVIPDGTQITMRGRDQRARMHTLDEEPQHLLADVEVGDHAVLQRPDRLDVPGRAADHALGLDADRERPAVAGVDGDHRRFVEHHTAPAHVDERVGSSQVDRDVAADDTGVPGLGHRRPPAGLARSRNPTGLVVAPPPRPGIQDTPALNVSGQSIPGKNNAISRAADSGPSLPWTRFSVSSIARSPRTVPGAASCGLVAPINVRTTFHAFGPSTHDRDERRARDEGDEIVEERLALVFGVVLLRGAGVEQAELHRKDAQTLAFETPDDLADEVPFDRVGLAEHERAFTGGRHGGARLPDRKSGSGTASGPSDGDAAVHERLVHGEVRAAFERQLDRAILDRRQVDRVRELDAARARLGIDGGRRTVQYGGREVAVRFRQAVDPLRRDARDLDRFPRGGDLGEFIGALVGDPLRVVVLRRRERDIRLRVRAHRAHRRTRGARVLRDP